MSYANGKLICDADSHLMELPDFLTAFADASVRSLLPDLGATLTQRVDSGQHAIDTRRIGDLAVFGGHIEIGAHQHALSFHIEPVNGLDARKVDGTHA